MLARTRRAESSVAVLLEISSGVGVATTSVAGAAGIDTKNKQAAALEAQVKANAVQLAALAEQMKGCAGAARHRRR